MYKTFKKNKNCFVMEKKWTTEFLKEGQKCVLQIEFYIIYTIFNKN